MRCVDERLRTEMSTLDNTEGAGAGEIVLAVAASGDGWGDGWGAPFYSRSKRAEMASRTVRERSAFCRGDRRKNAASPAEFSSFGPGRSNGYTMDHLD